MRNFHAERWAARFDQGRMPDPPTISLYCCGCGCEVRPRMATGFEIYPTRPDLRGLPFWRCDTCGNHVGTHHKTRRCYEPLGCIPTRALATLRSRIHHQLDPLWERKGWMRSTVYARLTEALGRTYHTADLRTADEVALVLEAIRVMHSEQ